MSPMNQVLLTFQVEKLFKKIDVDGNGTGEALNSPQFMTFLMIRKNISAPVQSVWVNFNEMANEIFHQSGL